MSDLDLNKFVDSKTIKISDLIKTTHRQSRSFKDLFVHSKFVVYSEDGRKSIDRSKVKVRRSLLLQYQKSKSTVDLKKLYNQFLQQKEKSISVAQIKRKFLVLLV